MSFSKASLSALSSQNQIFNDAKYFRVKNYVGVEQDLYYSNLFFCFKRINCFCFNQMETFGDSPHNRGFTD